MPNSYPIWAQTWHRQQEYFFKPPKRRFRRFKRKRLIRLK